MWQNIVALTLVALAAMWMLKMLLSPVLAALRPSKDEGCGGGCGCSTKGCSTEAKPVAALKVDGQRTEPKAGLIR